MASPIYSFEFLSSFKESQAVEGGEKVKLVLNLDRVGGYLVGVPIDQEEKFRRGTQR